MDRIFTAVAIVVVVLMLTGCATPIDWNGRIGVYTYNQAIMDFGKPMAVAKLNDGSTVADWMTRRGTVVATPGTVVYSPSSYAPRGVGYDGPGGGLTGYSTTYFPAQFLRLEFDADGRLKAWKKYSK